MKIIKQSKARISGRDIALVEVNGVVKVVYL